MMKIFAVIFCFLVSVGALAQSSDTTRKAMSVYQLLRQIKTQPGTSDPLIMLNDSVYTGDIHLIKDSDITDVEVIKGDDAKKLFGPKAQNGAFMMKTKRYMESGIYNYPGAIALPPKNGDSTYKDTSKDNHATAPATGRPVIVVDGVICNYDSLKNINPNDIISIDVISKDKAADVFPDGPGRNGIIVVVTKANAIKSYQKKFSAFSKKYKSYLEHHQNNDTNFLYVVDGIQIQGKPNEIINKLYKIPDEKIKEVGFNAEEPTDRSLPLVIINTKQ